MREFKILIHFPVECEYYELYEDSADALDDAIKLAVDDAKELAGTRGIKTWENFWNLHVEEILDISIEDGKKFIDKKYEDYLRDLVYVEVVEENSEE